MASNKQRMNLAVALFEQGFAPELVESAVKVCKTFDTALAWLGRASRKRKQLAKEGKESSSQRQSVSTSKSQKLSATEPISSAALLARVATPSRSRSDVRLSHKAETCAICYSDAPATQAVQLGCRHGWYCLHCMKMHADTRLSSGDVCVPCPECRRPIQDYCLKEFLSSEIMEKLHKRSICQAVASSSNLYSCPTANCDMCVEVEDGEEAWLKKCPKCKKGCCLRCGAQPYHKGMSCQEHALRSKSDKVKKAEVSLRKWMRKTGTKQCPQCKMAVSKEDLKNQASQRTECHKMLCRQCGTRFCYKCLALLTDTYSCGCSIDAHNFINPLTGRQVTHLRKTAKKSKQRKTLGRSSTSKASGKSLRGRPRKKSRP